MFILLSHVTPNLSLECSFCAEFTLTYQFSSPNFKPSKYTVKNVGIN